MKKKIKFEDLEFKDSDGIIHLTECEWVDGCPLDDETDDVECGDCGASDTGDISEREAKELWKKRIEQYNNEVENEQGK